MLNLPSGDLSYWKSPVADTTYDSLTQDIEVDVVIVGGGITGLTSAYLLKRSGLTVAVLEKNTIGSGTTGGTTGKVTSQHNIIYNDLKQRLGEKTARIYGEANQAALEKISALIKKEKIDCDWEVDDSYVYTADPDRIQEFKSEARVAASLGLPASFETTVPLPFQTLGAVKFANQAKMHARKYSLALASLVHGNGSHIAEQSNVIGIRDGEPATVRTKTSTITAKDIIVATKVPAGPLVARVSYAALEYPHTSYVVSGKLKSNFKGMYISPDKGHYSILTMPSGKDRLLLIGGERHIPGIASPTRRQQKLADYAQKYFGISTIDYRWKAMDYLAYDDIPLIGKVYPWSKHMYTATGFKKWGLTTSMVAGDILHDMIMGRPNSWSPVFDSLRLKPIASIPHAVGKYFG